MSRIRVLPEAVAARIAAGEVVERPASAVKELVENALDAGASRVEVTLEEGGKRLVRVVDDGHGMDRDDALLAFEQHATSKVAGDFDLGAVSTLGFRGEALAALGACARVTLVTAEADGEGTRVRFEGGRLRDVAVVGAPRGTSVEVTRLFANQPARRKFLRSSSTELSHSLRFLELQAMACPAVHFSLHHGRPTLDLPPVADLGERVSQLFGREFAEAATRVQGERGGISVTGWLVRAGQGSGRFGHATLVVNGRAVSDRLLFHALREAGRELFGVDKTPGGLLVVTVPAADVDVNVHPAKREVRFARPWEVHDAVRDLIRGDVVRRGFFEPALAEPAPGPNGHGSSAESAKGPSDLPPPGPRPWLHDRVAEEGAAEAVPETPHARRAAGFPAGRRVLAQHRNTYVLVEDAEGLVLVDQHCAHERVLFDRLIATLGSGVARQGLLEPAVVDLPRRLLPLVEERRADLESLGFEVEEFGEDSFAVRSVPEVAGSADPAELVRELIAHEEGRAEPLERVRRLAATVACRAAVTSGTPLTHERMAWITDRLFECDVPTTCPHGRVALLRLSDRDLDLRFGRTWST